MKAGCVFFMFSVSTDVEGRVLVRLLVKDACSQLALQVDLRVMDNCLAVTKGIDHVFNLAADMGGMGFIQSNHGVIMYNNTMISFNMLEASRINGVQR
jgi:nucleoside-diphosphate-sugar epimerase